MWPPAEGLQLVILVPGPRRLQTQAYAPFGPAPTMAIHPELPGLDVSILIHGVVAVEHGTGLKTESNHERPIPYSESCCYIEAETGKSFQVRVTAREPFLSHIRGQTRGLDLQVRVFVDGRDWSWSLQKFCLKPRRFCETFRPYGSEDGCHREYDFSFRPVVDGKSTQA